MEVEQLTDVDILSLCKHLTACFDDGREFKPLDRTEGGIKCIWPGKRDKGPDGTEPQGKVMAFEIADIQRGVWPHVEAPLWQKAAYEEEREIGWEPVVVVSPARPIRPRSSWQLNLKFKWWGDDTPKWTKKEAEIVKRAFVDLGFSKNKKRARQQEAVEDEAGFLVKPSALKKKMRQI